MANSYLVTGLIDGTSYGFTVAAENAVGLGSPSGEAFATPLAPSAPIVSPVTTPTILLPPPDSSSAGAAAPSVTAVRRRR